jgi:hypothetical protein
MILSRLTCLTTAVVASLVFAPAAAQEFEREPIRYGQSEPDNRVSQLIDRLERGEARLDYEPHLGYLRSLLTELEAPVSSQMLVFSKTSLQRQRISPRTPRALYFSDDVYVGFCQQGDVIELSAVDPQLGAVFYTLDQQTSDAPRLMRQGDNCLICHASSQTKEVPGHLVRSVFADAAGMPLLASGTHRIDHTSPLKQRWGGWYVTGTHGEQKHLGNLIVRGRQEPSEIDNSAGQNVTDLQDRLDTSAYLSPHSDIVALMVLEHQADAHNLITRANFLTRQAMYYQQSLNRELGEPPDKVWDSTKVRIKSACEPLVEYLLMSGEAELTAPVKGTSSFATEFAERGPRDRLGRSLRDFDLKRRLFKYPCSYLIYSPSVKALPPEAKEYVFRRLAEVLSGEDQTKPFAHLTASDRQSIREILIDTLADWHQAGGGL